MGYGASALRRDSEADNWLKIAALSGRLNEDFTNEAANLGANALMKGEKLPEGMSDAARNQAYLTAPRLEEGAIFEKKNQFMQEATAAAKEKNVPVNEFLMNPPEHWFREPSGYKAYASIAKEMSEANINNGTAIKSNQALGLEKFKQFDVGRSYVNQAIARGDKVAAANGLKQLVAESPVPFKLGDFDEQTGTFDVHELDMKTGNVSKGGGRVPIEEVLKQVSGLGQQMFVSGAMLASFTAKEINNKAISEPSYFKDKSGNVYTGVTLINPNTLTDTTLHLRDSSGKEVAVLNDPTKLGEMGFTAYDVKFEKDQAGLVNERKQGRNLDASYANLGAEGVLKRLSIDDKRADMSFQEKERAHKASMWDDEKASKHNDAIKSSYAAKEAAIKQKDKTAEGIGKLIFGSDGNSGTENFSSPDSFYQSSSDIFRDAVDVADSLATFTGGRIGPEEASRMAVEIVKRSSIDPQTGKAIKDASIIKQNQQKGVSQFLGVDQAELSVMASHRDWPREKIVAAAKEARAKAAESQRANEAQQAQATAAKEADAVFSGIAEKFQRLKNQESSHQYGMSVKSDEELWIQAAQDPMFGKGLYDLQQTYFKNKSNVELLDMAKQWYKNKRVEEERKLANKEMARVDKDLRKKDKQSFHQFGAANLTAGRR